MTIYLGMLLAFLVGVLVGRYCKGEDATMCEPKPCEDAPRREVSHRYSPISRRPERLL